MEISRRTAGNLRHLARTENWPMFTTLVLKSLLNQAPISVGTLLTLATCAALVTLFTTITFEVRARMTHALRGLGANAVAYPVPPEAFDGRRRRPETPSFLPGNQRLLASAATAPAETDWAEFERVTQSQGAKFARLTVRVGLIKESPVAVVTADPAALEALTPYWVVAGKRTAAQGECLVGRHVAEARGLKLGQTVRVEWPAGGQSTLLSVAGIVESGDEDDERVFATPPAGPSDFSYALLSVAGGETAIARLQAALAVAPSRLEIKPLRQVLHGEEQVLDKISVLCLAALGAVLALTALGVSAWMLSRVVERKKEFALLQALGARKRSVVKFLLAESATVGGIAAVLGFAFGTLLAGVVVRQIFKVNIAPHGLAFAAALVVTTAVALLAGAIACRRRLRLPPATALKGE